MSDDAHRALFQQVSKSLIEFARNMVAETGGYFAPTDTARMLMSAALVTMANDIGRTPTVAYLRELAAAAARQHWVRRIRTREARTAPAPAPIRWQMRVRRPRRRFGSGRPTAKAASQPPQSSVTLHVAWQFPLEG